MTYSVKWMATNVPFAHRFDVYLDYPFFEHQIHWFSIFNSFMMVIFLTGLVSMILMRILRIDYAKYAREDDLELLERDVNEESGWKLVHGDVFRPHNLVLLSALVGMGAQHIAYSHCDSFGNHRDVAYGAWSYCHDFHSLLCSSFIAGYVSGGLYSRNSSTGWIKSMILTASLFPFLCFGIGFILSTIAIFYSSLAAIPFGTMVVVFILWAFISFPLALLGAVVGRNWTGAPNNPCRLKMIPRPIPEKKWYLTFSVISLMGGLLPFGSIFVEMYFGLQIILELQGAVGYLGSTLFVRRIYRNIKCDQATAPKTEKLVVGELSSRDRWIEIDIKVLKVDGEAELWILPEPEK